MTVALLITPRNIPKWWLTIGKGYYSTGIGRSTREEWEKDD